MSLPQWMLLATIILAFSVLAIRPLDAPRSFLIGLIAYFVPGLIPRIDYKYGIAPTDDRTVIICTAVMLASVVVLALIPSAPPSTQRLLRIGQGDGAFTHFLGWAGILFLLALMAKYGPLFFAAIRSETMLNGYEQIIFRIVSTMTLVFGTQYKNRFTITVAVILLLVYTINGDRTAAAMATVACLAHLGYSKGYTGFTLAKKTWPVFVGGGLFVVLGKQFYISANALFRGDVDLAVAATQSKVAAGMPEPVFIFQLLNQTVSQNWHVDISSLKGGLIGLIPFSAMAGYRSDNFNRLMQNELFPAAKPYSLAFNPWAEGWAIGGWFGVFVVWSILVAALLGMHHLATRRAGLTHGVIMILIAYVGVYCQRNTILNAAATVVQLLVATVGLYGAFLLWNKFKKAIKTLMGKEDIPEPDTSASS
jgi:hypothetical protein